MKAIKFEGFNLELAKDQPQYETLPVYLEMRGIVTKEEVKEIPWQMTACFEFTDEEIEKITATKRIYYTQMLFGNNFHPMDLQLENPINVIG